MLQRIQTIYFSLVIICLGVCCTGMEFFRFVKGGEFYSFSVFGIEKGVGGDMSVYKSVPIYLTIIGLCLFTFMTLMSYKNIKRQLKWSRSLFFIYVLMVILFLIYSAVGKGMFFENNGTQELGLGYLFFIAGLPFSFLALIGVKKDKNLLDSLNRLR
mgnify:CR=1 FL=1